MAETSRAKVSRTRLRLCARIVTMVQNRTQNDPMTCSERAGRTGFLRASLYVALIFLYTFVLGVPCLIFSFFQPRGKASYWFIRTWARLLLWTCGVRTEVTGRENIPLNGPFLIMSTHNSHFDIPVLMREVPRQFRIVAKKSLFKIPVFGWIMTVAGYVSVDREKKMQAFASLDKAARSVTAGMPLLIFPEGTRSPDGSLGSFKKGGFVLATKAKVPIVSAVIEGTYHVLPKSTWRICPGLVKVVFGTPIDTSAYSYETKDSLMEEVRQSMFRVRDIGGDAPPASGLTP
ncbi:MAG: 1-acyl-sn-glycerol-3-phosphate acyltransferase [Candidatus Hydrogenedentota bacterium]|nr:MAG: 1-acyl-sn-glycerol-3-phosphate acyltransferase [Candidatus Hydrogenedentota bacterium]